MLLKHQDVLAAGQLLFPSLDLLLSGKGVGLENAVNHGGELRACSVELGIAFKALDGQGSVISVLLGLSSDGQLGHFGRWLISFDDFSSSADVEGERVAFQGSVEPVVHAVASAAAVEALEADIETGGVILLQSLR
jgi:hypothetical protein